MQEELQQFILRHRNDDIRQLALKAHNIPNLTFALNQIAGWQKARTKLPTWADTPNIIYPPHLAMEQCSSEFTANYKAQIARQITHRNTFVDLTGGLGVDFTLIAPHFTRAIYVEQTPDLCAIARNNHPHLGLSNTEIINAQAEDHLKTMPRANLIYIDPSRRTPGGAKTTLISHCTPDILRLLPQLSQKADNILIKLSPMLDIHDTLRQLRQHGHPASQLHILSHNNECKELLLLLTTPPAPTRIICTNNNTRFTYSPLHPTPPQRILDTPLQSGMHLYEPNAYIMKAGCHAQITHTHPQLQAIAPNSHLFVSPTPLPHFPGRHFIIHSVHTFNKKELRTLSRTLSRANITVRNFPQSAADLRKKLKLSDGGPDYLFATTDNHSTRLLIHCRKF